MGLCYHPTVWGGKVGDAVRLEYAADLQEMLQLNGAVADMLDDMVADDNVKVFFRERKFHTVNGKECVALADLSVVIHIHGADTVRGDVQVAK